jgi:hypothetical protein
MNEIKNTVGRPRELDRIQIGKDFVEWAKTHPDCLTVPHFSTANGYSTHRMINWCHEDPEFEQYYIEAKEYIGINRLNATRLTEEKELIEGKKALDKTIYLRHVHNFDPDMRKSDREEKAYEAKIKGENSNNNTQCIVQPIMYVKKEIDDKSNPDISPSL